MDKCPSCGHLQMQLKDEGHKQFLARFSERYPVKWKEIADSYKGHEAHLYECPRCGIVVVDHVRLEGRDGPVQAV